MRKPFSIAAFALCLGAASCLYLSISAQPVPAPSANRPAASGETRAAHAYEEAVKRGPLAVYAFLAQFPKGADLHVHLSGAVYAETFIRDAAEDRLCVDTQRAQFARDDKGQPIKEPCADPLVAASRLNGFVASKDQPLYDSLVNSFSMRSFVPTPGYSGHDQFFATFDKFKGLDSTRHAGEWVDEVAARAAEQNQQYLELMQTPTFSHAIAIANEMGWPAGDRVDFAALRQKLLDRGLRDEVAKNRAEASDAEDQRRAIEHCSGAGNAPACDVQVRFIYQLLRASPPQIAFAQALLGFEVVQATLAAHEPGFVGVNFVQPEDGYNSMTNYTLEMQMLEYLHSVYPTVHISLHAGELAPGLVPPEGLLFHVRQAVELAHAERIGHGVDLMYEGNPQQLLKELAAKHVMVEINLSSNEGILGVQGNQHPFPIYLAAHVPVALSTDDEGVSRINLTHEYQRAALDYHLTYAQLKQLARTGMEHNFLPGESLWAEPDVFITARGACRGQALGSEKPSSGCKELLDKSQKAAAQWELERRLRVFEAQF